MNDAQYDVAHSSERAPRGRLMLVRVAVGGPDPNVPFDGLRDWSAEDAAKAEAQIPFLKTISVELTPAEMGKLKPHLEPLSLQDCHLRVWNALSPETATKPATRLGWSEKIRAKAWLRITEPTRESFLAALRANDAALDEVPSRTYSVAA